MDAIRSVMTCEPDYLVMGISALSFYVYCRLAGEVGSQAFSLYLPPVVYMSVAYTCVFHLFAVLFRHSTIVALIYALFVEPLVSNMPGIINRVAVTFYGRSIIDHAAQRTSSIFSPASPLTAAWALCAIALCTLLLGR
ncbi:hypothetical protein HC762_00530, partial [bacterium]|nr:hypothetical protein [bacterium]